MKIGDKIWVYDQNHRVYPKDNKGFGSPIWREYWRPRYVVAENRASWYIAVSINDKTSYRKVVIR